MPRLCLTQEAFGVPPHAEPDPERCRICGQLSQEGPEGDQLRAMFGEEGFPRLATRPASLARRPRKQAPPAPAPLARPGTRGPGWHLKALVASLGLAPKKGCSTCNALAGQMDAWGVEGCRINRTAILMQLRAAQKKLGWLETAKAGLLAVVQGLALKLDPRDLAPSLLDEAIRRAKAEPPAPPTVEVVITSDGIGDAMLALTAAAGVKRDSAGKEIVLVVKPWQTQWVELFGGAFDHVTTTRVEGAARSLVPCENYRAQQRTRLEKPRWQHYAEACGTTATLPRARPLDPDALAWAGQFRGCVLLSPWSHHQSREWSLSHWLRLERLLIERGFGTAIIEGRLGKNRDRAREFAGPRLTNAPAARVAAAMKASACVVGNDSGMCHVAGALQVPAVALGGAIRLEQVFGVYGTVRCVMGPLSCSGCHGRGPDFRAAACNKLCASLQAITPEAAADAVEEHVLKPCLPLSALPADKMVALARAVRLARGVPGDLAELGVYRGGSALAMCQADPAKTLHAFDTFAGLPADDAEGEHRRGEFAAPLEAVRRTLAGRAVEYHPGLFPGTAAGLGDLRYSVVHIDGDLYETTLAAIDYFWPRLAPGGLLLFDDVGWPKTPGVRRALEEAGVYKQLERPTKYQGALRKPA